jgi:starch synthase
MKVLFVASEAFPLVKTGGLGDVGGALPPALAAEGADVRLLLPAYREARARADRLKSVARLSLPGGEAQLLETRLPGTRIVLWLLDHPPSYDRPGDPYHDAHGRPWPDNAVRFALLCRAACAIALGQTGLGWRPDLVHAHDWQAGLAPALLAHEPGRPATVFTIHNLAYQGLFPAETFSALRLPPSLWSHAALEFHGRLSFIKGGIVFADRLTTVSPGYAHEIQTPEHGHGLDGLLRHRAAHLSGILNGIDDKTWNPARDIHLVNRYSARRPAGKPANKLALQTELNLAPDPQLPLLGMVGRLVAQKGVDLVVEALTRLDQWPLQLAVLGTGERRYEQRLLTEAARRPGRLAVRIGYDEPLAHRILAAADLFLMPSRFEPCGLSQLYAMRYGAVPVARRVGGLADTVVDANPDHLRAGRATGILFDEPRAEALAAAVERALALHRDRRLWRRLMLAGMRQDHGWRHSAAEYLRLYHRTFAEHRRRAPASHP